MARAITTGLGRLGALEPLGHRLLQHSKPLTSGLKYLSANHPSLRAKKTALNQWFGPGRIVVKRFRR